MKEKITNINGYSILIPIYNQSVVRLVKKLYKQAKQIDIPFEILCFDDQSKDSYKIKNKELSSLMGVNYMELSENLGRAKIRNWLVKSAGFDLVLFLDGDSKVISKDYISNYLKAYKSPCVISGGRIYNKNKPTAKSKLLHWTYGSEKESKPANIRSKDAFNFFHTNNFLAHRDILIHHPFNEDIEGYGYEDLLMGNDLKKNKVELIHIDNPIEHLGLETNKNFINKTIQATHNLAEINKDRRVLKTRMVRSATTLRDWGLEKTFMNYVGKRYDNWLTNLQTEKTFYISAAMLEIVSLFRERTPYTMVIQEGSQIIYISFTLFFFNIDNN